MPQKLYKTMKVFERGDMDSYTSECFSHSCNNTSRQFEFWLVSEYRENVVSNTNDVDYWLLENGASVGEEVLILNFY